MFSSSFLLFFLFLSAPSIISGFAVDSLVVQLNNTSIQGEFSSDDPVSLTLFFVEGEFGPIQTQVPRTSGDIWFPGQVREEVISIGNNYPFSEDTLAKVEIRWKDNVIRRQSFYFYFTQSVTLFSRVELALNDNENGTLVDEGMGSIFPIENEIPPTFLLSVDENCSRFTAELEADIRQPEDFLQISYYFAVINDTGEFKTEDQVNNNWTRSFFAEIPPLGGEVVTYLLLTDVYFFSSVAVASCVQALSTTPPPTNPNTSTTLLPTSFPEPTTDTSNQESDDGNLSPGIVAGSVIGALLFAAICVLVVFLFLRRQERNKKQPTSSSSIEMDKDIPKIYEMEIKEEIGAGTFGKVYRGIAWQSVAVALKQLNSHQMDDFISEANTLAKLKHPNIVLFLGIYERNEKEVFLVTEYVSKGSLLDLLRDAVTPFSEKQLLKMTLDAACGMHYLETQKIVHRDLSARNLLVDEKFTVKVADFGMSRKIENEYYKSGPDMTFPVKWSAPEVLKFYRFSSKSDSWSFGVVMYEIITHGRTPYSGMNNQEVAHAIVDKKYRMPQPEGCGDSWYKLMSKCWSEKPNDRPSFLEISHKLRDIAVEKNYQDEEEIKKVFANNEEIYNNTEDLALEIGEARNEAIYNNNTH